MPTKLPAWEEDCALVELDIIRILFRHADGNARAMPLPDQLQSPRSLSPLSGHCSTRSRTSSSVIPKTSAVLMTAKNAFHVICEKSRRNASRSICCDCLGLPGSDFSRGYIQHWLRDQAIPDRSCHRIFKAADQILKAGRPEEANPSQHEIRGRSANPAQSPASLFV